MGYFYIPITLLKHMLHFRGLHVSTPAFLYRPLPLLKPCASELPLCLYQSQVCSNLNALWSTTLSPGHSPCSDLECPLGLPHSSHADSLSAAADQSENYLP